MNTLHLNFHSVNLSSAGLLTDGQAPSSWQCPPDDWRLAVYTVYSVYSPEHPNLASVNDPPAPSLTSTERSEKAEEDPHPPIKILGHIKELGFCSAPYGSS